MFVLCICWLLMFHHVLSFNRNSVELVNGMEFDGLSRSRLLKILAAFEKHFRRGRPMGRPVKSSFNANFAVNKYTKKFVYPEKIMG
nr:uncharacterized protein LOC128670972 [Plodia interpunctella]